MMREQEGLISASDGLPHECSPREFSMVTHWRDLDALKQFAGEDRQTAVVHPDEAHLLREHASDVVRDASERSVR